MLAGLVLLAAAGASSLAAINPAASDLSTSGIRQRIFFPRADLGSWRGEAPAPAPGGGLLALLRRRRSRLRSVCDSFAGRQCDPIDTAGVEDLLWDAAGLTADTLYDYRFRRLLLGAPPPRGLRLANHTLLPFDPASSVSLFEGMAVPLDWPYLVTHLDAQDLSRLLMALEWDQPPAVPPGPVWHRDSRWTAPSRPNSLPNLARPKYTVSASSDEGLVKLGRRRQDRAFDFWDRDYYVPGGLVAGSPSQCLVNLHEAPPPATRSSWLPNLFRSPTDRVAVCPAADNPNRPEFILLARSYQTAQDIDRLPLIGTTTLLGKAFGALPNTVRAPLNLALENTFALPGDETEFQTDADGVIPALMGNESSTIAGPMPFVLSAHADAHGAAHGLKHIAKYAASDKQVLAKLSRDHRTWPHIAAALGVNPDLVDEWIHGKNFPVTASPVPLTAPTRSRRPRTPGSWFTRIPYMITRGISMAFLRLARLYVDTLIKGYGELPVLKEYKAQVDEAIQRAGALHLRSSAPSVAPLASDAKPPLEAAPLSARRQTLYREFLTLSGAEISAVESASYEGVDYRWKYPRDSMLTDDWLSSWVAPEDNVLGTAVALKGAWHRDQGLTSHAGEIHMEPSVVVSDMEWAPFESPLVTGDLHLLGYAINNRTIDEAGLYNCLHQFRRREGCHAISKVWDVAVAPTATRLSESELVSGSLYQRVDFIFAQWNDTDAQVADSKRPYINHRRRGFLPAWTPYTAPATWRLKYIDLHVPKLAYEINYDAVDRLMGSKSDANLFQSLVLEGIYHSDLYPIKSSPDHRNVVLIEGSIRNSTVYQRPLITTPSPEDEWAPAERLTEYLHKHGTVPMHIRQQLRPGGLDRGAPILRGYQLPLASQSAYDASLVLQANRAIFENRGRPFLTADGSVVNADHRPLRDHATITFFPSLPVEAPVTSMYAVARQHLMGAYAFSEFASAVFVDQSRRRELNKAEREKMFAELKSRLESKLKEKPELQKTVATTSTAAPPAASPTTSDAFLSEVSHQNEARRQVKTGVLKESEISKAYKDMNVPPQSEQGQSVPSEVETASIAHMLQDSETDVVELLRQAPIDEEISAIVKETIGEMQGSVIDLIRDVTVIAITEDPETGETINRKIHIDLNDIVTNHPSAPEPASTELPPTKTATPESQDRTIAFETLVREADGREHWMELDVPIRLLEDHEGLVNYILANYDFEEDEADRIVSEILNMLEGYDLSQFDAVLDMLDEYNLDDDDLLF